MILKKHLLILSLVTALLAFGIILAQLALTFYKKYCLLRMDPLGLSSSASSNSESGNYDFLLVGDSLIANWNPSEYKNLNLGIPSQTSAQILHRMQIFNAGISAKRAIICAGGNDLKTLRVLPEQKEEIIHAAIQNIRQIIAEVENKCEMIYVLTIPPIYSVPFYLKPLKSTNALLSSLDAINTRLKTELKSERVTVIDVEQEIASLDLDEIYASDGIHLSQKAYNKILDAITKDN